MKQTLSITLTNVYAKGDFTAQLYIGSQQAPVNLIVDSGSSTLVIEPKSYSPENDKAMSTTSVVQEVNYGIGGWAGAVVHTELHFLDHHEDAKVAQTSIAVVEAEPTKTFGEADGIFGLAYHHLNKSFDVSDFFKKENIAPASSLPWPFDISKTHQDSVKPPLFNNLKSFKLFLWQYPEHDIKPLFTQIADQHLVANCFGFQAQRSSVHVEDENINLVKTTDACVEKLKQDPLNNGTLILGNALSHFGHNEEDFLNVPVQHDVYYNVTLKAIQVGNNTPIPAAPLEAKHEKAYFTNAIIDTGASLTVLPAALYSEITKQLADINESFKNFIEPFESFEQQYKGINQSQLNLNEWPDVSFIFEGENNESVKLVCPPTHYWQLNSPIKGNACFKLLGQLPNWPNQTIVGLPLLTNYYVIFDRAYHQTGVVKFAIK